MEVTVRFINCVSKDTKSVVPQFYKNTIVTCYMLFSIITGQLLDHIQNRIKFTEKEASYVIKDLASALQFLHKKGDTIFYISIYLNCFKMQLRYQEL